MKISCIIVEDLISYTNILKSYLLEIPEIEILGTATNEEEAINLIKELKPDLLFLDIKLGKDNGFEVLNKAKGFFKYIIFTTAYSEYSLEAFQFNTIHYILKPYKKELIIQAVEKAICYLFNDFIDKKDNNVSNSKLGKTELTKNIIFIPISNNYIPIEIFKIIYIEASTSYSIIHTEDNKFKVSKSLKIILESLGNNNEIIRVHKTYAINLKYIKSIKRGLKSSVILSNDIEIEIPISNIEKDDVFKLLGIK